MSCSYYTFRQNDYYCTKKGDYVNSDTYYRYCKGYYYDECPIYRHEESSGCYLTTIVCKKTHILEQKKHKSVSFRNKLRLPIKRTAEKHKLYNSPFSY